MKRNFEEYLPDQYKKACAGRIVTKGNFAVFILLGDLQSNWETQYQKAEEYFYLFLKREKGYISINFLYFEGA